MRTMIPLLVAIAMVACTQPADPRVPVAYRSTGTAKIVSVPIAAVAASLVAAACQCDDAVECDVRVYAAVCGSDASWCAISPSGGAIEDPSLDGWHAMWDACLSDLPDGACTAQLPPSCGALAPGSP